MYQIYFCVDGNTWRKFGRPFITMEFAQNKLESAMNKIAADWKILREPV